MLTFDRDYITERQKDIGEKPKDIKEGIMKGGESLAKSVFEGATGIIKYNIKVL
jgi:hypothetical protein